MRAFTESLCRGCCLRKLTATASNRLSVFALIVVCWDAPVLARATCIEISVDVPKSLRETDLVFSGLLLKNQADVRLTFQGEKIWKGPSKGREIVVYELGLPDAETYRFKEGENYLIFASVLSPEQREFSGVVPEETVAYGFRRGCGGAPWPLTLSKQLDKLVKPQRRGIADFPVQFCNSLSERRPC
jgi:hypothetical protein